MFVSWRNLSQMVIALGFELSGPLSAVWLAHLSHEKAFLSSHFGCLLKISSPCQQWVLNYKEAGHLMRVVFDFTEITGFQKERLRIQNPLLDRKRRVRLFFFFCHFDILKYFVLFYLHIFIFNKGKLEMVFFFMERVESTHFTWVLNFWVFWGVELLGYQLPGELLDHILHCIYSCRNVVLLRGSRESAELNRLCVPSMALVILSELL